MVLEAFLVNGLLGEDVACCEQDLCMALGISASLVMVVAREVGCGFVLRRRGAWRLGEGVSEVEVRTAVVMLCVSKGALLSFAWYLHAHAWLTHVYMAACIRIADLPAQHDGETCFPEARYIFVESRRVEYMFRQQGSGYVGRARRKRVISFERSGLGRTDDVVCVWTLARMGAWTRVGIIRLALYGPLSLSI